MTTLTYACRCCGAHVWSMDCDVAARIRASASLCALCDADAADDVRVRFGAVVRRETARLQPVPEPLPEFLGKFGFALVFAAALSALVAPVLSTAFVVGGGVAWLFWFAQLVGRFFV